jgi:hypothetical protein
MIPVPSNTDSVSSSSNGGEKKHKKTKSINIFTSLFKRTSLSTSSKDSLSSNLKIKKDSKSSTVHKITRPKKLIQSSPHVTLKNQNPHLSQLLKASVLDFPRLDVSCHEIDLTGSHNLFDTDELVATLFELRNRVEARDSQQTL